MENAAQSNNENLDSLGTLDFALWLQAEFTNRCKRNPRYSLRAFANLLDIDPSSLSQYMAKKRKASAKMKLRFLKKLGASPEQLKAFSYNANSTQSDPFELIESDKFHFISDWYHIAILELSCTEDFDATPRAIGARLGITTEEARAAVERLKRLNLIFESKNSFVKSAKNLSNFMPGQTSQAHRVYQKQIIEKAALAVEECPPELKDITSISMSIDMSKLPEARKLIAEFRKQLCNFMEDGKQEEVYNLSVQLYPVSKVRRKK